MKIFQGAVGIISMPINLTNQEWMDATDIAAFLKWMSRTKRSLPVGKDERDELIYKYLANRRRSIRKQILGK